LKYGNWTALSTVPSAILACRNRSQGDLPTQDLRHLRRHIAQLTVMS
jgi:hypothetical protein